MCCKGAGGILTRVASVAVSNTAASTTVASTSPADVGGREPLRRPRTRHDSQTIVASTRARRCSCPAYNRNVLSRPHPCNPALSARTSSTGSRASGETPPSWRRSVSAARSFNYH
eukprot:47601-Prymnesium_polylepis.1